MSLSYAEQLDKSRRTCLYPDLSAEPRKLLIFSGRYHSRALFKSEHKSELNDLIIEFFKTLNENTNPSTQDTFEYI